MLANKDNYLVIMQSYSREGVEGTAVDNCYLSPSRRGIVLENNGVKLC